MFTEERQSRIEEVILERGSVSVQELSELFNVSEVTIRKDLDELQKSDTIKRTHGGAVAKYHALERAAFQSLTTRRKEEKQAIARKALSLIEDGDTLLMDGSSTTSELAHLLEASGIRDLTVITTSLIIAQIVNNGKIRVVLLGGDLDPKMSSVSGPMTEKALTQLSVDKGFVGINGIDRKFGFSADGFQEAAVKLAIGMASRETYVLADHSKFRKKYLAKVCELKGVFQYLITDRHGGIDYTALDGQVEVILADG